MSEIYNNKYDAVILAGGDIFSATWIDMYLNLQTSKFKILLFKSLRKVFRNFSNGIAKFILKGKSIKPWILDKDMLLCDKLIYNTVDGDLYYDIENKEDINKLIKKVDYISLRNEKRYLEVKKINSSVKLYPDSVISISRYIKNEELEDNVSDEIKEFVKNNKYYVFQTKNTIGKKYFNDIVMNIEKINKEKNLKCILLPIGYAQAHEDQIILNKIYKKLDPNNSMIFDFNNVYEIAYLIKHSTFFVGTSLHGLITSIAYNVPHIAFTNEIYKQIVFLQTWKTTPIIYTDANNLSINVTKLLYNYSEAKEIVCKQNNILQNLVENNFKEINKIIID